LCCTCGCGEVDNDHGEPANITYADLEAAAKAGEVEGGVAQVCENIAAGAPAVRREYLARMLRDR
jgi:hypothetical protein